MNYKDYAQGGTGEEPDYGTEGSPGKESERNTVVSYISEKFGTRNSDFIHALFNITKCFIGLGILACPAGFKHCGIILGIITIAVSGVLNLYTLIIQGVSKERFVQLRRERALNQINSNLLPQDHNSSVDEILTDAQQSEIGELTQNLPPLDSYGDIGREAFGWIGQFLVTINIMLLQTGTVLGYFMFIIKQLDQVMCSMTGTCGHTALFALMTILIVIPLVVALNAKYLSYISFFSLLAITFSLVLIVVNNAKIAADEPATEIKYFDMAGFPLFFGLALFIYEGNAVSLQIESSLKKQG
jgi:amino acid permease